MPGLLLKRTNGDVLEVRESPSGGGVMLLAKGDLSSSALYLSNAEAEMVMQKIAAILRPDCTACPNEEGAMCPACWEKEVAHGK